MSEVKEGYIVDYISGQQVKATPEEIDAVQVYAKMLVEDYGYPVDHIQTHPQYRVKASPSDPEYRYPVDIAVFSTPEKRRGEEIIVVECKKPTREDGIEQLKAYLRFCEADLGVWFNGQNTHYIHKVIKDGRIEFDETIINIPKYGQRLEDIGKFKRSELQETHNLKAKFVNIRNFLAGNAVGVTRDEEIARQLINIILCKLYDEKFTQPDDIVSFRAGVNENPKDVKERILKRFAEAKNVYPDVLGKDDNITLDSVSLAYIVGELQNYSLLNAKRDVIGDAFEVIIHRAAKGDQGQYFTPKNVVKTAIKILDPGVDEKIIDPACGSGGFLIESLKYLHNKIEENGQKLRWPAEMIQQEKMAKANLNICGIEKDTFLSKIVKAYMILVGDGKSGIFCEDSLNYPSDWQQKTQARISLGAFDVLLANPPFGSKIPVIGEKKLKQFPLGYKWKQDKKTGEWVQNTASVKDKEAPQILFIDRCLDLVKEGGRLALVLPDGVLCNPTDGYIVQEILRQTEIIGLIDLPMSTFLPMTPTKTHLVFLKKTKTPRADYVFFMSYAKSCGHDKRGREVAVDDLGLIPEHLTALRQGNAQPSHLGWYIRKSELINNILLPKYYNPDLSIALKKYEDSGEYVLKTLKELEDEKVVKVSRGVEVGSENYGMGEIPFVRTSEVSNWEITSDCTHCIPVDIYEKFKKRQNLEVEDILVVNDGTYLMGRAAMITESDLRVVIQSHFRRIKVLKKDVISPYLLMAMLGLEIVQRQIESKAFRQGTISTLGNRLMEVKIPIPIDLELKESITKDVEEIISNKNKAKQRAQSYIINGNTESLMGIQNKGKLGNL
jgi:type I restriction enzyme M protein